MPTLYYKNTCAFSRRVLGEAEDMGIKLDLKDISTDPALAAELEAKGGKQQVPFLWDEAKGVSMYESGDIIDYLRENYGGDQAKSDSFNGLRIHRSEESCDTCQ